MCLTHRGVIAGHTFQGITGLSASEIVATDWVETLESWTWPDITGPTVVIDATPDYVLQAIPVAGGYVYTRQSFDLTTVDLVGPAGVITSWVSVGETATYALAVDASGDYWIVVALEDGSGDADNGLWRVTPAGVATQVVSGSSTEGVSPGPICTTPDGAVWYAKFGPSRLFRWAAGVSTQVPGVDAVTPVPRPDSSIWYQGAGWGSVTPDLVVTASSPCTDLDSLGSVAAAWSDDWSIVALHDKSSGDIWEIAAARRWSTGHMGWTA